MTKVEKTHIETPKGKITITTLEGGFCLQSPKGTNHNCFGRNMFYSADLLRAKLELFYGKEVTFKALDKHFCID